MMMSDLPFEEPRVRNTISGKDVAVYFAYDANPPCCPSAIFHDLEIVELVMLKKAVDVELMHRLRTEDLASVLDSLAKVLR
jgi:hypothetical protein